MKRHLIIYKFIIILSYLLTLSGCGISADTPEPEPIKQNPEPIYKKPEPVNIDLTISAANNLNPDIENRASPIVVRIYQLTHIDTFNNSDFFALYENDQALLNKDLKYHEELEIKPGQLTIQQIMIDLNSKYIAVLAAFRDLDKAQWKSIMKIDALNPQPIKIELGEFTIQLNADSDKKVPLQNTPAKGDKK